MGTTSADPGTNAHGFLLDKGVEGPFTPIDFPGAPRTGAFGINDRGQIVGIYHEPRCRAGWPAEPHADADDDVGL